MARKRDHKAEYAKRKAKAKAAGYPGVSSYRKARKNLGTPRNASPLPRPVYQRRQAEVSVSVSRECQKWSDRHSHSPVSKFNPNWTNQRIQDYWHTFVEPMTGSRRKKARDKRRRIWEYMDKYGYTSDEWNEEWKSDLQGA